MKAALIWKPQKVPLPVVVLIAVVAVAGYILLQTVGSRPLAHRELKVDAAVRTAQAYARLRDLRRTIGPIDPQSDPLGSGLIGVEDSPITSKHGLLPAKQTTINPNWAGAFVEIFEAAGLHPGDVALFGVSGSFPALNVAALVAAEAYQLKPVMISSVLSSQWGANDPAWTWLDMQTALLATGLISTPSAAASVGGRGDRALGMPAATVALARAAIRRAGLPEIDAESIGASVAQRLNVARQAAGGAPVRVYLNIGGGQASLGGARARPYFHPGTNWDALTPDASARLPPSLMKAFGDGGIPVVNVTGIRILARRFQLPWRPRVVQPPGEGGFYTRKTPAVGGSLTLLAVITLSLVLSRLGLRRSSEGPRAAPRGPVAADTEPRGFAPGRGPSQPHHTDRHPAAGPGGLGALRAEKPPQVADGRTSSSPAAGA